VSALTTEALGDLVEILSGFAFDAEQFVDSGDLPIVRIRDVVPGYSSTYYRGEYDPKYLVRDGDLLIGMDGGFHRGRWRGGRALLNQRVCRITPSNGKLDDDYLFHFLPTALKAIEDITPFVTVKHLSTKSIRAIEIPLPPLAEQRRIAEILDRADALRAKRRAALAQLDTLAQSIFLDLFGDPATNPRCWETCAVGDVTTCVVPGRDKPKSFTGDTPWITTDDLVRQGATNRSRKGIGLTDAEISQVRARVIPNGSVVLCCVGDLGITSIAGEPLVINQQLHAFQCNERIKNVFLMFCLPYQVSYMRGRATSTTLAYMNKSVCNSIPITLPPIDLQETFAERVEMVEQVKASCQESSAGLDDVFASLRHRAFRGEL